MGYWLASVDYKKIIALFLVLVLPTASFSSAYGTLTKFEYREDDSLTQHTPTDSAKLVINLDLREASTTIQNQEVTVILHKKPTKTYHIMLNEAINVSNVKEDGTAIVLIQSNTNQVMTSRINNPRKEVDTSIGILLDRDITNPPYDDQPVYQYNIFASFPITYVDQYLSEQITLPVISSIEILASYNDQSFNNVEKTLSDVLGTSQQSSELFVTLFVFSTFVIIRSEKPKIRINNFRKTLSYSFIVLLGSSAIILPISNSHYAYAQGFNQSLNESLGITAEANQISLVESIGMTDSVSMNTGKLLTDNLGITESTSINTGKLLTDN